MRGTWGTRFFGGNDFSTPAPGPPAKGVRWGFSISRSPKASLGLWPKEDISSANMDRCLYCFEEPNSEEHPLPAAFGEFTNAPTLKNYICVQCNSKRIGLLDEQYVRCGPEGLLRKKFGIAGREHHEKVNPFYRGSAGGRRIEFLFWDEAFQCDVNVELLGGNQGRQLCELILREKSGQNPPCHIALRPEMSAEELRKIVSLLNMKGDLESRISYDPVTEQWAQELIKEAWPSVSFSEGVVGATNFQGGIAKFQVTGRYYRAIAKIGFHYFLTQFPKYTGLEAIFSDIRSFIIEDTEGLFPDRVNQFIGVRPHPLAIAMSDPKIIPNGWVGHLICAEIRDGVCLAHYEPFISPEGRLRARTIYLGRDDAGGESAIQAHLHRYFEHGKQGRFSGEALSVLPQGLNLEPTNLAPEIVVRSSIGSVEEGNL